MLLAAVLVWALVSTGLLGWLVLKPSGPSLSEIWAADASTLERLKHDFDLIAFNTEEYLSTNDTNWTVNGANWAGLAYSTVRDAATAPGGFPSGQPLGFNATAMCVALGGYEWIVLVVRLRQDVATVLGIYENLSARLSGQRAAPDPLTRIGATNITAIHALMVAQWDMYLNPDLGQGSTITSACGIF